MEDAVVAALKEMVLPELALMKQEQAEIKSTLAITNKRLDDVNAHLVDQSRRIDALREELTARLDEMNKRLDETNKRLDTRRDGLAREIQETNKRLDRLYVVIVRREEHYQLSQRLDRLEQEMAQLQRRVAD